MRFERLARHLYSSEREMRNSTGNVNDSAKAHGGKLYDFH